VNSENDSRIESKMSNREKIFSAIREALAPLPTKTKKPE